MSNHNSHSETDVLDVAFTSDEEVPAKADQAAGNFSVAIVDLRNTLIQRLSKLGGRFRKTEKLGSFGGGAKVSLLKWPC